MTSVLTNFRYDIKSTLAAIQKYQCNHLITVPTILIDIMQYMKMNTVNINSIETIQVTGTMVPAEVVKQFCKAVPSVKNVQIKYGISEVGVVAQTDIAMELEDIIDNVGTPISHQEIQIVHPKTGKLTRITEEGELLVRGCSVFMGYYNDHIATRKALDENKWYHTG